MTLIEEQVIDTCGYSREYLVSYLRVWLKQKLLKLEIFDFMVWFQKDIKRYVNHKIKVNDVQTHKIRQVLKGLSFGKFSLSTFRRKGHIDKWVKKPTYYHFSCLGSGSCESNKKIYNSISSFWSLLKYYFFSYQIIYLPFIFWACNIINFLQWTHQIFLFIFRIMLVGRHNYVCWCSVRDKICYIQI